MRDEFRRRRVALFPATLFRFLPLAGERTGCGARRIPASAGCSLPGYPLSVSPARGRKDGVRCRLRGTAIRHGSRPVSRVLSGTVIRLGRMSPSASSDLPGSRTGRTMLPYSVLLRVGFTLPRTVAGRAVRSYRTFSPLPDPACAGHRRYVFCGTFRRLAPPRRYLAPCPAEPGLSSAAIAGGRDCPADSPGMVTDRAITRGRHAAPAPVGRADSWACRSDGPYCGPPAPPASIAAVHAGCAPGSARQPRPAAARPTHR